MQIPYLFTFYEDYNNDLKANKSLYSMLDQNQIYNKENITRITKTNKWFDQDGIHPGVVAHCTWAQLVQTKIEEIYETN
jgi:hypothetical protein